MTQIGFVRKAGGFHGGVLMAIDLGSMEDYAHLKFFFLELEGKPVPFAVENIEMKHGDFIVKFEDVDTVEEARKLQNKKVFVEQEESEEELDGLVWTDLVGYTIMEEGAGALGVIEQVDEYPQQWIAKCIIKEKEVLIPLNEEIITEIDEENKQLHMCLPEGLLDLYLGEGNE